MSPKTESSAEGTAGDQSFALPHLKSLDRVLKIPVVDATWQQTQSVYGRVKEYNSLLAWAFGTAESMLQRAISISAPIVHKFDRPIQIVDYTLAMGIDKLEENAPIIKEKPEEIYNQAKTKVFDTVKPYTEKVNELRSASLKKAASLKDMSWKKANKVLATQYGTIAITGVDTTAQFVERLLDYIFPRDLTDPEEDVVPTPASDDPVLHTVQTVGRLSNKIVKRVHQAISPHIKSLRKEDVSEYIATLSALFRAEDDQDMDAEDSAETTAIVLDVVAEAAKASAVNGKS